MDIIINRLHETDDSTFGVLQINNFPFCMTLEPSWRNNKINESCIPIGRYPAERYKSYTYGKTLKILYVPDRTDILFHVGNFPYNTKGCILLGEYAGQFDIHRGIFNSLRVIKRFRDMIEYHQEFNIIVKGINQ
jgi:hypothetical protein